MGLIQHVTDCLTFMGICNAVVWHMQPSSLAGSDMQNPLFFTTCLNGWNHRGRRDLVILVHEQLHSALLVNAEQLCHTLVQHRQQVVLLDEVKDCRLLLAQVDGQGQIKTPLQLVQLGCHLQEGFCVTPWGSDPAVTPTGVLSNKGLIHKA